MANEMLPIKVLLPDATFDAKEQPGGGARKIFEEPTTTIRQRLESQVAAVGDSYRDEFRMHPDIPAVALVRLKDEALAKSHRPARLLSDETCPIIGVGALRELYVKVTPSGLSRLREKIRTDTSTEGRANISTIAEVRPITVAERLGDGDSAGVVDLVEVDGLLKVELFDYQDQYVNGVVLEDFRQYLTSLGSEIRTSTQYAPELLVHEVATSAQQVTNIARHPAIRRASAVPKYFALRHQAIPVTDAIPGDLAQPASDQSYPTVGVIDSGLSEMCATLETWVVDREEYVPHADQDREHGTFVGGLVAFGPELNVGIETAGGPCRLVDVIAIPRDDPSITDLSETQLVAILQDVIPKYPDVRVWNLSLGSDVVCRDDAFSDLANRNNGGGARTRPYREQPRGCLATVAVLSARSWSELHREA